MIYHLVHTVLFTKCEQEYGLSEYETYLGELLNQLSVDYERQKVLVAGHITISGGYEIIAKKHLRLASGHHAKPLKAGQYLRFDSSKSVEGMDDLLECLDSVF